MDAFEIVIYALVIVLTIVAAIVENRLQRRMHRIATEDLTPAFDEPISLPIDRSQVERLSEHIVRVCVMRNMGGVDGGEAGSNIRVTYTAFVVDSNTATHDLRTSRDWGEVQEVARLVADAFDAEFIDTSYGTF